MTTLFYISDATKLTIDQILEKPYVWYLEMVKATNLYMVEKLKFLSMGVRLEPDKYVALDRIVLEDNEVTVNNKKFDIREIERIPGVKVIRKKGK